jgi:tetratricopeptide (TPR) repeat protein
MSTDQSSRLSSRPFGALGARTAALLIGADLRLTRSVLSWARSVARMTIHVVSAVLCIACMSAWAQTPSAPPPLDLELQAGLASHKAGRFKEAIDIYTEVIKKHPRAADAYDWRGMAYDELNELDKALADFNEAINLAPGYADAYNNRGEIFRKKKMYREALGDYRKALQLDANFPEAHYNIALVMEADKKNDLAAKELLQYIKLKPDATDKTAVLEKIKSLSAAAPPAKAEAPSPPAPGAAPSPAPLGPQPKSAPPPAAGVKAPPPAVGAKIPTPPGQPPLKTGPPPSMPGVAPVPVPGLDQLAIPPEYLAMIMGLGFFALIVPILVYLFFAFMLFLIAQKTHTGPAWLAFIPLVQVYLMVKIAGKPLWWIALLFLPVISPAIAMLGSVDPTDGIIVMALTALIYLVSIAASLFVSLGIADARGKSVVWGVLLFLPCTNLIALGYLGLSKE